MRGVVNISQTSAPFTPTQTTDPKTQIQEFQPKAQETSVKTALNIPFNNQPLLDLRLGQVYRTTMEELIQPYTTQT